jgi:hypothetical protein
MFETLRPLSNQQILADTDAIVIQDRKLTLRLLAHLHEIERRKLYLVLGYGSMFVYCTSHLKLSEPAAARRLRTARCLARFPQLGKLLETGDVNLSTVSMVAKFMTPENAGAVLERISGRSRRGVERVMAELEPRTALPPDRVRTVVVAVPVPTSRPITVAGDSEKSPSLLSVVKDACRAAEGEISPDATVSSGTAVMLERHVVVQLSAREEVMTKLERVRSLASHRLRGAAPLEQVIELLADYFIAREDPAARQERREKRATAAPPNARGRLVRGIPARTRDQVFVRDRQQCTYVSADGRRCASTNVLQIDHVKPVARGGGSTMDNLRLLCAHHNRLEAERLMGRCGPRDGPRV